MTSERIVLSIIGLLIGLAAALWPRPLRVSACEAGTIFNLISKVHRVEILTW